MFGYARRERRVVGSLVEVPMQMGTQVRVGLAGAALLVVAGATSFVHAQQPTAPAATAGRVLRPRLLIHVVANLEKSVEFFRQGMDLEVVAPPRRWRFPGRTCRFN
jgi:hypothetical protein